MVISLARNNLFILIVDQARVTVEQLNARGARRGEQAYGGASHIRSQAHHTKVSQYGMVRRIIAQLGPNVFHKMCVCVCCGAPNGRLCMLAEAQAQAEAKRKGRRCCCCP